MTSQHWLRSPRNPLRKRPRADRENPTDIPALDATTLRIWSPVLSVLSNIAQASRREDDEKEPSDEPVDALAEALARKCLLISLKPAVHVRETVDQIESIPANMDEDFMIIDGGGEDYLGVTDEKETAALEEQTYRFAVHVWLIALWTNGIEDQVHKVEEIELNLGLSSQIREDLGRDLVEKIMGQLLGRAEGEPGR